MSASPDTNGSKRYTYFPGCSLKATGVAYEESLLTLFRLLDLSIQELDDWNCCGATSYMAIHRGSALVLGARNLALVQRAGATEVMVPCSACYLALSKTQDFAEHYPAIRTEVQEGLERAGLPFPAAIHVRHPLEILFHDVGADRLKAKVARRWTGGPIACYYGCQAVRPYSDVDHAYNPTRMEQLLKAVGVPTVAYPLKTRCCGGSLTGTITDVGVRLNQILLKEAVRKGAQAMVTICPLCQFNLDAYQGQMRETSERLDMPVLYLTQVLGWVLGGDRKALGLHRSISGTRLLDQWLAPAREEAYV